jgi:hypothetical protein
MSYCLSKTSNAWPILTISEWFASALLLLSGAGYPDLSTIAFRASVAVIMSVSASIGEEMNPHFS